MGSMWQFSNFRAQSFRMDVRVPGMASYRPISVYFRTSEHAYQCHKANTLDDFERIQNARTPARAKQIANSLPRRQDWDLVKVLVMRHVLRAKFERVFARRELLRFVGPIIELTTWHDTFWGVCVCSTCGGKGHNMLGRLLDETRAYYAARALP